MIIGHERQIKYLEAVVKNERLAHAYLFYGPERVGKFTVARHLAGFFPEKELIILGSENTLVSKKDKRKEIPTEDIRELKRRLSYASRGGEWRIAIVDEAERMSSEAANAFLKLLEEPGEQTLFILVTSAKELIPSTIVSRAQAVRFSLVPNAVLGGFLKTKIKKEEEGREILTYAAGRPGVLMRFLEEKGAWESERKFVHSLWSALRGGAPEIFHFTGKVAQDEKLRVQAVEYAVRILRKAFLANPSYEAASRIKRVDNIATLLQTTNVNPRLGLDVLLLEASP